MVIYLRRKFLYIGADCRFAFIGQHGRAELCELAMSTCLLHTRKTTLLLNSWARIYFHRIIVSLVSLNLDPQSVMQNQIFLDSLIGKQADFVIAYLVRSSTLLYLISDNLSVEL
ncbi:hypothetical protein GKR41_00526 [Candidatus Vallotia lariciata]|nr:hypothetical protein GKR41_00526 [Candidatus Vallotia lariciata]